MVIRAPALPDYLDLASFGEVFCTLLGWDGVVGFSFHIHGQEFTSFPRRSKVHRKALRDFQLRYRETLLYTFGGSDDREWEFRVRDFQVGGHDDDVPVCLAGQGAAPPEYCGGPTGYRLMLKRQKEGESLDTPSQVEMIVAMLASHKEGFFEVIAGRSVVAFRREREDTVPPPKCFGFLQTYDPEPRR